MPETATDDASIIGDECHIVSPKRAGPRSHESLDESKYDKAPNLLVLCKVHHKQVDDQESKYKVEYLRCLKRTHESWVRDSLTPKAFKEPPQVDFLVRIASGKDLMAMISGTLAYIFDHDEPESKSEMELISDFHQNVQDWADLWSDLEAGARVRARFAMSQHIAELEQRGLWVFAKQQTQKVKVGSLTQQWPILVMTVVRKTNPAITPIGELASIVKEEQDGDLDVNSDPIAPT